MSYRDLVKQAATVSGTGPFTLGAAVSGEFQTMHIGRAIGEEIEYTFVKDSQSETGFGTLTGATTLTRTRVVSSSNAGALVNFTAGTSEIRETVTSESLSGFASVRSVPFSAAIPLNRPGTAYMDTYTVTGPLTLTAAAGAVQGALAYLRIIADGTNAPNFSAFKEWGGSSGYDNRNGIVNQLQFFYDGADLFYAASQAIGAVPVPVAATGVTLTGPTGGVSGAASTNFTVGVTPVGGAISGTVRITPSSSVGGDTFTPAYRDVLDGAATGTFTVTPSSTGARIISVTNNGGLINPASITYTATASATAPAQMAAPTATQTGATTASVALVAPSDGGSPISGYTVTSIPAGGVDSNAGTTALTHNMTGLTTGTAYTFTAIATNGVGPSPASPASNSVTPTAAAETYPRMVAGFTNLTESGTGPYEYTALNSGDFVGAKGGILNKSLQNGVDGSFALTKMATASVWTDSFLLGVTTSATPVSYTTMPVAMLHSSSTGNYQVFELNVAKTATNTVSAAFGDIARLRRAGSSIIAEVSKDGGAAWTTIYTSSGQSTGALNFQVELKSAGKIGSLTVVGLA